MTASGINFRVPILDDAQMLLDWRCDLTVDRYMYTHVDHSLEKQKDWLNACEAREGYEHFIIQWKNRPIGFLSYSFDPLHKRGSSGSYMVDETDRKKFGGLMHTYFMDYLFYRLGMNKAMAEIRADNKALVKIQRILKLNEVGVMKQHVWKEGVFYDVIVFELLKSDYETHPRQQSIAKSLAAFPPISG